MNYYYKREWEETTGEELTDSWGTSTYYFETNDAFHVTRQIQVFQNGNILKYDVGFIEDEFGFLTDQPLNKEHFYKFIIYEDEFIDIWNKNRKVT